VTLQKQKQVKMQTKNTNNQHIAVLLEQVLKYLAPQRGETYLDVTAGYGGHAAAVLEKTQDSSKAVLIDRDQMAVDKLKERFGANGTKIIRSDFYTATQELKESGQMFNMILADLGVSSPHLDIASRGFSFRQEGPLDMRMDQTQALSAETIVNTYSETHLTEMIRSYGEDPKASRIAKLIVQNRPISTTTELAKIVARAWPGYQKIHPATRTFQALRLAVNDELELLRLSLPIWIDLLAPGGRLVVISFHSLEDRIVKHTFDERGGDTYDATLRLLTKRPVTGDAQEIVFNPRARSAKLRAAVKINIQKGMPHANTGKKQLPNL
jgi:16S rRNA (cytosine1402-N4)-methyltransferase